MKALCSAIFLATAATANVSLRADTVSDRCAAGWTSHPTLFESTIQYDDMQSKANPTVHVLINGKAVKMMLDTGAQEHVLWDASLLDEHPISESKTLYAHVASAEGQKVVASVTDEYGNTLRQAFYLLPDSILRDDGYSGILSPQRIAQDNVALIDLEKNCFFTSAPFDIRSKDGFEVSRSSTIANSFGVLAIPVSIDHQDVPLLVDTGATITTITSALVESKPKGEASPRAIDMFGAEIPQGEHMRLVDLMIGGRVFSSIPVIPRSPIGDIEGIVNGDSEGLETYGLIGMDILKNRAIYHDAKRNELILVRRPQASEHTVVEHATTTE